MVFVLLCIGPSITATHQVRSCQNSRWLVEAWGSSLPSHTDLSTALSPCLYLAGDLGPASAWPPLHRDDYSIKSPHYSIWISEIRGTYLYPHPSFTHYSPELSAIPWFSTFSTHKTILHVWWAKRLPWTWELGKCIIGISKYPLCAGRKEKVALSHFWQGIGKIGKGKTYGHSRAEPSHCRQKLGAGTEHHEQHRCIHTLKWYWKF